MATQAPNAQTSESGFRLEPYAYAEARALSQELGLPEPVAVTLVRRGYRTVDEARAFLEASDEHDPLAFEGMAEAVATVRDAIAAGRRITVHGDYDADGVCSTSILVRALRDAGADCDWFIPDRLADGYGLTGAGVELLRERGTELLITTDCGITCADEVAAAVASGMEVIVTDHHQPGDLLPACTIIHPVVSGYPCPDLCATGVAYKVARALNGEAADDDLDLVALATVADLVPLLGENRALVRRGLEVARRARRPGLRALMAASRIEPERLDEGDFAFRLAPRINAAGRLHRADAGVELMLTADEGRAEEIAAELDRFNHQRRETEAEVLQGAQEALRELPPELADAPGLVIAGTGWHAGVVGIVASRMVERTGRPVVLIAVDSDGRGRGSGRSVPGFDLLGGLEACSGHLARFGGHRAAAGLEIEADRIPAFREAFAAHAREALGDGPAPQVEAIDAVVGRRRARARGGRAARPAGTVRKGEPARAADRPRRQAPRRAADGGGRPPRPVQPRGRHGQGSRGRVRGERIARRGRRAAARRRLGQPRAEPLERGRRAEGGAGGDVPRRDDAEPGDDEPGPTEWSRRLAAGLDPAEAPTAEAASLAGGRRSIVDRRGRSGVAAVAALASSGESVLVICADALRRRALVEQAAVPQRFGGGSVAIAAGALADEPALAAAEAVRRGGGVALADWSRVARDPTLAAGFEHVVLIDPPPLASLEQAVDRSGAGLPAPGLGPRRGGARRFAGGTPSGPRGPSWAAVYRALREAASADGVARRRRAAARPAWRGGRPRSPEAAARHLRVLQEVGVVAWAQGADPAAADAAVVVSSDRDATWRDRRHSSPTVSVTRRACNT